MVDSSGNIIRALEARLPEQKEYRTVHVDDARNAKVKTNFEWLDADQQQGMKEALMIAGEAIRFLGVTEFQIFREREGERPLIVFFDHPITGESCFWQFQKLHNKNLDPETVQEYEWRSIDAMVKTFLGMRCDSQEYTDWVKSLCVFKINSGIEVAFYRDLMRQVVHKD